MKREKSKRPSGTSIRYTDKAASRAVRRAAEIEGVGPSAFVRDAAQAKAEQVLAEHAAREGKCSGCGRPLEKHGAAA